LKLVWGIAEPAWTYMEALWALAQCGVVLLDKVPADLILGDLGRRRLLLGLAGGLLVVVVALCICAVCGRGRLCGGHGDSVCLWNKTRLGGEWSTGRRREAVCLSELEQQSQRPISMRCARLPRRTWPIKMTEGKPRVQVIVAG
jgi:hypothetical protein